MRTRRRPPRSCLALLLACAADGPAGGGPGGGGEGEGEGGRDGGGGPPTPPGGQLRVEPEDASVAIVDGQPGTLEFRALLIDGGVETDVTGEARFALDDLTLGRFVGARFESTSDHGGRATVRCTARGLRAQARLTVRLRGDVLTAGVPADAPARFSGDEGGVAPTLVYPPDGVLVPPNLNELELHFTPGAGQDLFEVTFAGSTSELRVYTTCAPVGGGCAFTPDEGVWLSLADGERGRDPVSWSVRGVAASGGAVGRSASRRLAIADEDITGGLYYWNAGAGAVKRFDFGFRGQVAESYLDAGNTGGNLCVGCHVLSRNGERVAVGMDFPGGRYEVYGVAARELLFAQGTQFGGGASFFAFSPDATTLMTSSGASIVWRDAASGAVITNPLVANATMPDWSPDGAALVFARASSGAGLAVPQVDGAGLFLRRFSGTGWGPESDLVPFAGQNNYYPTFSPDSRWVLFNRSPGNLASMDAADAQVWVVPQSGGSPLRLAAASSGGDSWPKWAPEVYLYRGGPLMWFTFSSRRPFGLRPPPGGAPTAQLWMAAFTPDAAETGADPSYPAFRLPFQEPGSGNHIAQWVTEVVRRPCQADGECDSGEFCEDGRCFPLLE